MITFYQTIDEKAKQHASLYYESRSITEKVVQTIIFLYKQVEGEKSFNEDTMFESAYQMSITPLFEFYIGRFLYHLSKQGSYSWKIYLRRQVGNCAPDIRIEKNGQTIAIIEVKIKGGWIQSFFSNERFEYAQKRKADGESKSDPQAVIDKQNQQLVKYKIEFKNPLVYMLLPTFNMVHRKKDKAKYEDYKENFERNTGKYGDTLVVFSKNLRLNLANIKKKDELNLTCEFEYMIEQIVKRSI